MLALLIMAAQSIPSAAAKAPTCDHLDEKHVISLITRADNEADVNPYYAPSVGELIKYWKGTCSEDRYNASKDVVKRISGLLSHWQTTGSISSILIDVGPNLKVSLHDVDSAIATADKIEEVAAKTSSHIVPESGRSTSNSLKCVKVKILTGRLHWKYCSYISAGSSQY